MRTLHVQCAGSFGAAAWLFEVIASSKLQHLLIVVYQSVGDQLAAEGPQKSGNPIVSVAQRIRWW